MNLIAKNRISDVSRTELVASHHGKGNFREVSQYNQRILLDMHQFMKEEPIRIYRELKNKSLDRELLRRFRSEVRGGGEVCDMGMWPRTRSGDMSRASTQKSLLARSWVNPHLMQAWWGVGTFGTVQE